MTTIKVLGAAQAIADLELTETPKWTRFRPSLR